MAAQFSNTSYAPIADFDPSDPLDSLENIHVEANGQPQPIILNMMDDNSKLVRNIDQSLEYNKPSPIWGRMALAINCFASQDHKMLLEEEIDYWKRKVIYEKEKAEIIEGREVSHKQWKMMTTKKPRNRSRTEIISAKALRLHERTKHSRQAKITSSTLSCALPQTVMGDIPIFDSLR